MKYAFRQVREGEKTEALPREARKPYVKRMGYLSSRPAAGHKDALICADGRLQMLIYGQPKEETVINVEMTAMQKKFYRAVYDRNTSVLYGVCDGAEA